MKKAVILIGCHLLLASLSMVSGLCSTCLEESCHDNGECIIGCVPGYVGQYCDEDCPSRCLNKVCHLDKINRTITCTDGCEPDYCGATCEELCPGGYVTCDRQCGSCNVTVCPERRYGDDCSSVCSERYGKCDRVTGQCIRCVRGYYGGKCTRKCPDCFTQEDIKFDKCLSYCDNCKSEVTCQEGFHGDSCELPCSPGCEYPERGCNRATGECFDGCVSGYHGPTCNYKCSEHCLAGRCNRATGECSAGCVSGYHGLTCNYTCNSFCEGRLCNQHDGVCTSGCISGYTPNLDMCEKYDNEDSHTAVAIAVPITVVCLLAGMVTAVVIWRRRRSRRPSRSQTAHAEEGTNSTDVVEPLLKYKKDTDSVQQIPDRSIQANTTIVTGPDPAHDILEKTKIKMKSLTSGMIHISAVDTVVDMLQSGRNWVTITGNAGDGKTTLGYLVLRELCEKTSVYSIEEPEECRLLLSLNTNRLILLDDRFGAFTSDQVLIDKWKSVINDIHKHFTSHGKQNKMKVIFISRKNVVNEARNYLGHFRDSILDPENVVDLSSLKIKDERLKILDHYLKQGKLKVSSEVKQRVADLDIAHGFPHCSMMYPKLKAKKRDLDIEEFFKTPLKFLDITTAVLYTENCKDLFELMIKNNGMFDAYSVEDDVRRVSLLKVEREQEGSYITVWKNGVCVFAHPSIYESVLSVICDTDPLFCVKYATLSVIRQKLTLTSDERQKSPTQINVKPVPAVLKALAERFRQDILQGDYTVFSLRFCDNEDFCKELVASCVYSGTADPEQSKQHIDRPGKDGRTMLWTAVHGGRKPIVRALLEHGADVNHPDQSGKTFLLHLCQQNEVDIEWVKEAIRKGADCNMVDETSNSPLLYMCKKKNIDHELLKTLVLKMVPDCTNTKDRRGMAALHYLCGRKSVDIELARFLVTGGRADINLPDGNGATPLHWLCVNCKVTIGDVKQLAVEGHGDINKRDGFSFTPLHYLCARSMDMKSLVSVIKKVRGDVNLTDKQGNTSLHFICTKKKRSAAYLSENILGADGDMVNSDGLSVKDHLLRKGNAPQLFVAKAMDGTSQDLVRGGEKKWTPVLGRAMILNSEKVHKLLQVEDFGRVLTNLKESGDRNSPGQFSEFWGTCSSPVLVPPSPSPLTAPPSYWETSSTLTRSERCWTLLQMGLKLGRRNMDEGGCVSDLPNSVCVSVSDDCPHHPDRLCIQVWRGDQEDRKRHQVGECVSLSLPTPGEELTLTFGLVLDVGRGKVGFIDVERGQLLCKLDLLMKEEVSPMFCVDPYNDECATRMRLVSGREICFTDRKIHLIQQVLSD